MNQLYTELIEIIKVIQKVKLIYQKYQFLKLLDENKANKIIKQCIDKQNKNSDKRPKEIKKLFSFMYENDEQEFELAYSLLVNVVGVADSQHQQKEPMLTITPKMQKII